MGVHYRCSLLPHVGSALSGICVKFGQEGKNSPSMDRDVIDMHLVRLVTWPMKYQSLRSTYPGVSTQFLMATPALSSIVIQFILGGVTTCQDMTLWDSWILFCCNAAT